MSDNEWAFVAPYLTLMTQDAPQREHPLREVFNALRLLVRTESPWRYLPNDLPPWHTVYQQTRRWIAAGCFAAIVHNLREMLRLAAGRKAKPSAAILDGRTLQSSLEAVQPRKWSQSRLRRSQKEARQQGPYEVIALRYMAVDTLGHLLAVLVTPTNEQERAQVAALAKAVRDTCEQSVTLAYVDQGYTGDAAAEAAQKNGMALEVVKLPEAKKGFVRLPQTVAALHFVVFAILMLVKAAPLIKLASQSS